jgi:hypothetical protein
MVAICGQTEWIGGSETQHSACHVSLNEDHSGFEQGEGNLLHRTLSVCISLLKFTRWKAKVRVRRRQPSYFYGLSHVFATIISYDYVVFSTLMKLPIWRPPAGRFALHEVLLAAVHPSRERSLSTCPSR